MDEEHVIWLTALVLLLLAISYYVNKENTWMEFQLEKWSPPTSTSSYPPGSNATASAPPSRETSATPSTLNGTKK